MKDFFEGIEARRELQASFIPIEACIGIQLIDDREPLFREKIVSKGLQGLT